MCHLLWWSFSDKGKIRRLWTGHLPGLPGQQDPEAGLFPPVPGAISPGRCSEDPDCEPGPSTMACLPYRHVAQLVLQWGSTATEQWDAGWNSKEEGFEGSSQPSQPQQVTSMPTTSTSAFPGKDIPRKNNGWDRFPCWR